MFRGFNLNVPDEFFGEYSVVGAALKSSDERIVAEKLKSFRDKNGNLIASAMTAEWFPAIEASSVDLVETYVASGLGIGLSVALPNKKLSANLRALTLQKFPPVRLGLMWRGKKLPLVDNFLDMARHRAKALQ